MSDANALSDALTAAETATDILAALARAAWHNDHGGKDCPPEAIPTVEDLAAYSVPDPVGADIEAWFRLLPPPTFDRVRLMLENAAPQTIIVALHSTWCQLPERGTHPLSAAIRAWQDRPQEVAADVKDRAIAPGSLFAWANAGGRGPAILTHPRHDNELPFRAGMVEPDTPQLPLPGLEAPTSRIVPAPAIVLADAAGFGGMVPGRGARLDKRLLILVLLSVPMSERRPGGRYTFRRTVRDLAHTWLWPAPASTGTGNRTRSVWHPAKHGPQLQAALAAVHNAFIRLPGSAAWLPVVVRRQPDTRNLDDFAVFEVALPDEATGGPMIDRPGLIAAGVVSDPAFDGSLALAALWDAAKARNGGVRIYATRPKALRDTQGRLTRADGSLILGHPRNPFTVKDRLTWRDGDAPQRDWRHPAAVLAGDERHPQADKVPALDRNDRRRLFYGAASDDIDKGNRARLADKAEARLTDLEAQGRVVIEGDRLTWRVLEPAPTRPGPHVTTPTTSCHYPYNRAVWFPCQ